jgi:uncharacterized protein with FMN-binding domain/DMSO/TMAO reductase YedYZ heme-binding membrane subunit
MAGPRWLTRSLRPLQLQRRHRAVGIASMALLIGHIALIVPGYAATTHQGWWGQLRQMVTKYPGVLLALAGAGALFLAALASARAARRRLGYRRWRVLHLYAYLGIGLALPHQLWNGTDLVGSAPVRIGWWASWLAVVAVLLVHRVWPAIRRGVAGVRPAAALRPAAAGWFGALVVLGGLLRYPTSTHSAAPVDTSAPTHDAMADMDMGAEEDPTAEALAVPPPSADQVVVEGRRVDTEYGPVQVQIRVVAGRIAAAYAIAYPNEQLADRAVSSFALPELEAATVAAQNAHVDTVSGATTTSAAYRTSLQAALDAAHR